MNRRPSGARAAALAAAAGPLCTHLVPELTAWGCRCGNCLQPIEPASPPAWWRHTPREA